MKSGSEERKFPPVGADQLGDRLRRLDLVSDQRVVVHRGDDVGIAGKALDRQLEHVGGWREVAQPLEDRERTPRYLERETFADQARELGLVLERVDGGDDAGAVTEQEHRELRLP
jgi:hypothetical protein